MMPRELSGSHDGEKQRSDQESEGSSTSKRPRIDFATHGPTYEYQRESANREINIITFDNLSAVNPKFKRLRSIFESIDSIKSLKLEIDSKSIKNLEEILNKNLEKSTNELKRRKIRCVLFDLGDTLWTHRDNASSDNMATQSLADSRILFNDTHSTLKELQRHGFTLGVVTNRKEGGESFRKDLEDLGLLQYFNPNCIVSSADIGAKKPNPEVFSRALTAINVKPEESVMVGNSLYADISGAKAAGMGAIWKPTARYYAELQKELPQEELGDGNHLNLLNIAHTHEDEYYGEKAKRTTTLPNAIIKNTGDLLKILLKSTN